ncbi:MAG: hypothetical protein ACYCZY_11265 [Lacisediminihabitans sp.]
MRTSMNLPDGLLEQARATAAAEGSTVTQLMIEGLRSRIAGASSEKRSQISLPSRKLGKASVDLSDNRSVRDILDAGEDAAFRDPR